VRSGRLEEDCPRLKDLIARLAARSTQLATRRRHFRFITGTEIQRTGKGQNWYFEGCSRPQVIERSVSVCRGLSGLFAAKGNFRSNPIHDSTAPPSSTIGLIPTRAESMN